MLFFQTGWFWMLLFPVPICFVAPVCEPPAPGLEVATILSIATNCKPIWSVHIQQSIRPTSELTTPHYRGRLNTFKILVPEKVSCSSAQMIKHGGRRFWEESNNWREIFAKRLMGLKNFKTSNIAWIQQTVNSSNLPPITTSVILVFGLNNICQNVFAQNFYSPRFRQLGEFPSFSKSSTWSRLEFDLSLRKQPNNIL